MVTAYLSYSIIGNHLRVFIIRICITVTISKSKLFLNFNFNLLLIISLPFPVVIQEPKWHFCIIFNSEIVYIVYHNVTYYLIRVLCYV